MQGFSSGPVETGGAVSSELDVRVCVQLSLNRRGELPTEATGLLLWKDVFKRF